MSKAWTLLRTQVSTSNWLEAIRRRSELGRPSMTSMLVPLRAWRASWFSVGFGEERERESVSREREKV